MTSRAKPIGRRWRRRRDTTASARLRALSAQAARIDEAAQALAAVDAVDPARDGKSLAALQTALDSAAAATRRLAERVRAEQPTRSERRSDQDWRRIEAEATAGPQTGDETHPDEPGPWSEY